MSTLSSCVVATSKFVLVTPNAPEVFVSISVYQPKQDDNGLWACQILIGGLVPARKIYGEDSFQSLCLATKFAYKYLRNYLKKTGAHLRPQAKSNDELVLQDDLDPKSAVEFLDALFGLSVQKTEYN